MPLITLTSDWNSGDFYIAAVKGRILSILPDVSIVDISHQVRPFNSAQAAFILRNSWPSFPPGTIHLIFVNAESNKDKPQLAVKAQGQYFIGTDNGIFSMILSGKPEAVAQLDESKDGLQGFPGLISFTRAATGLASGKTMEEIGKPVESYAERVPIRATIEEKAITGSVIYIDSYQNAITNISRELFDRIGNGRKYEIFIQSKHYRVTRLSQSYQDEAPGEITVLFNSVNLLEVAINNGNAARLLNLDLNSTVRVEFLDK